MYPQFVAKGVRFPGLAVQGHCAQDAGVGRRSRSRCTGNCTRNTGFAPEIALEIAPELSALLDRIIANPRITTAELASALKVSRRTVLARITTLKEKGILRRSGPSKGGKWELIP